MLRVLPGIFAGLFVVAVAALYLTSPVLAAEHCGEASWYGNEHHGRHTASGAIFDQWGMTAAMPDRSEMGRSYRVRYRGRSVVVKITDLGPARSLNRVIDLSRGAARTLGLERAGVGRVCLERIIR